MIIANDNRQDLRQRDVLAGLRNVIAALSNMKLVARYAIGYLGL